MSKDLNSTKALIFRITHRDNIPWILDNGLHCRNSGTIDPHFVAIGNADLIAKRSNRTVPISPGGSLSDYIPFYFTPFSPMLLNIATGYGGIRRRGNDEIVILVSSLYTLVDHRVPFLFTDRHAYLATADFHSDLSKLDQIDWGPLQSRDFKRDPENPDKFDKYQAEALIHQHLPIDGLRGIACFDNSVESTLNAHLAKRELNMKVVRQPGWYF